MWVWAQKTWEPLKFKAEIPKTQLWSQKSQHTCTFVAKITTYAHFCCEILTNLQFCCEKRGFFWLICWNWSQQEDLEFDRVCQSWSQESSIACCYHLMTISPIEICHSCHHYHQLDICHIFHHYCIKLKYLKRSPLLSSIEDLP